VNAQQEIISEWRLRRQARRLGYVPHKSRKDCRWYFADRSKRLYSPPNGLITAQAAAWLESGGVGLIRDNSVMEKEFLAELKTME
jgi:hypothetical protein